ncbi:hypothetical protein ACGF4C_30635 [Streptomyces sp. NPDC048197]|uniref:hypothetical protein n=1 Tax=Streptomyces sp. NPDC048197 TaxID=3365511 RepID=UPI003715B640
MRDLIALLSIWLREPLRRGLLRAWQRARTWLYPAPPPPPAPLIPPAPLYRRNPWSDYIRPCPNEHETEGALGPLPEHIWIRRQPLDGHEIRFVRPYLRVHEQAVAAAYVRRAQRKHRSPADDLSTQVPA